MTIVEHPDIAGGIVVPDCPYCEDRGSIRRAECGQLAIEDCPECGGEGAEIRRVPHDSPEGEEITALWRELQRRKDPEGVGVIRRAVAELKDRLTAGE